MQKTLGKFLELKGSKTPSDYHLKQFGLKREYLKRNWFKKYKNKELLEGCDWDELVHSLPPSSQRVRRNVDAQSVYVIRNYWGHYKIGIAKDVEKRVKDIMVANSEPVTILYVFQVSCARKSENILHKRYERYHKRGEWFNEDLNIACLLEFMENRGDTLSYDSRAQDPWVLL